MPPSCTVCLSLKDLACVRMTERGTDQTHVWTISRSGLPCAFCKLQKVFALKQLALHNGLLRSVIRTRTLLS